MAYLYRHIRLDKNVPFYIGIGDQPNYKRAYDVNRRSKFWKYTTKDVKIKVEILLDNLSWEEACKKEIEFIKLYGRKNLGKGSLVNLTDGGDGNHGTIHSKEHREKVSKANTGKVRSLEAREKYRAAAKIRTYSDATRKKMSDNLKKQYASGEKLPPNLGKKLSEEIRIKISKGRKGIGLGVKQSEETRKKRSDTCKRLGIGIGRPCSEETRKKMSNSQKGNTYCLGHKQTEEHKLNKAKAAKLHWLKRRLNKKSKLNNN